MCAAISRRHMFLRYCTMTFSPDEWLPRVARVTPAGRSVLGAVGSARWTQTETETRRVSGQFLGSGNIQRQPPSDGGMTGFWCIEGFKVNHRILVLMGSPMSKAIARDALYRRRRFQPEIIELCVRWYLTYR